MSSSETKNEPLISTDNNPPSSSNPSSQDIPQLQENHSLGHKNDPFTNAGIFSRLFFCWSNYILYLSRKINSTPTTWVNSLLTSTQTFFPTTYTTYGITNLTAKSIQTPLLRHYYVQIFP